MMHWITAPVLLPALIAPLIAMSMRHDIVLQRVTSLVTCVLIFAVSLGLAVQAFGGEIVVYELGDWPAPFGIVLVLDRLSAAMVLLTSLLALAVNLYAIGSDWDKRGWHFHTLFIFQLMGVNGAFLTGDVFNLFVFFEVLLIASYGLMIHAGGAIRLRSGVQYVVMNLAGSTLFLFALGTIYGTMGTLNMADLATKVAALNPGDQALALVGGTLLLIVFAVKAAIVPVQFWLPGTYANAPAPVAALFAIMTKVGLYAIIRCYTIVFDGDTVAVGRFFADLMMPAALVTLAIGAVGVLGSRSLPRLIAFSVVGSMGTLMVAVALYDAKALNAALYYMLHSTMAAAALFLVSDLVARSSAVSPRAPGGLIASIYFAAAIAMAGMPPLSGFLGKLMVLDAARAHPQVLVIWAVILVSSLVTILGFVRAGSGIFWSPTAAGRVPDDAPPAPPPPVLAVIAACLPLALIGGLVLGAGPLTEAMATTAAQLMEGTPYIEAVLGPLTEPEG